MPTKETPTSIPFGPFEVDLRTQELRKGGIRLHLPGQSFQILRMLLTRPGELVTREEFDVQARLLARSREQINALETRVAELEARASKPNA